jgi:hypothetical protein
LNQRLKARTITALRNTRDNRFVTWDEGHADENGMFRLEWFPVRVGTVNGMIGPMLVSDTGNGELDGVVGGRARFGGHVNYLTGWVNLGFGGAGAHYKLCYEYAPPEAAEMTVQVVTAPVVARPRRLTTRWTVEFQ